MKEFLAKKFYDNTIAEWGIALLIIVVSIIVAKLLYWVINKFVKKLTKKSKTKFDDILIDMIEEPIVFAIIIIGLWYALHRLVLPENVYDFVDKVYYVLIIFNITWLIVRLFDSIVQEYVVPLVEKTETDLDDQLLPIVRKSIKITLWVLAVILALNNAGYNVGALLAGVGIGGLALAMAARDTVSNIFGGLTIFADKPFVIKDRIVINGVDGIVETVGVRSTRIRTLAGRLVTVPNSTFTNNMIENISSEPSRKVVLNLGLTYDTTHEQILEAIEILKDINAKNEHTNEKVLHGFNAFNDSALNVIFIYYINAGDDILGTQTEMNAEILRRFNEKGLEFAYPTQTIFTQQA